jgi:glycerophosphoryl diester phosphodiesterase
MGRKRILGAVLAVVAALLALVVLRRGEERPVSAGWPVNLAHRGASARAPENTLESFRLGLEAGAGGLELDVHMTRDGHVVVIHDPTADRTTDRAGAVAEMSLEELKALDAGYRFGPGEGYPYRGRGLRVPTLEEVYEAFPHTPVNIEIKEAQSGVEEAVLGVIRAAGAEKRTIVASGRHGVIRRFRRACGGTIPTAASRREILAFYASSRLWMERLVRPAYAALQVPANHRGRPVVTRRFVDAAHARGVRVDVWTINDPREMRRLLDLGADTVMTDRPDTLARVLGGREGQGE